MIELSIKIDNEWEKLDVTNDFDTLFSLSLKETDVDDPTGIFTSYSKSFTIPLTPKNKRLLNNVNDINSYINGNKKYDCIITNSGMFIDCGYIFLDDIIISNNVGTMNCTFFSRLCTFFDNLSKKDNGTPIKISDFHFGWSDDENTERILWNANTIKGIWDDLCSNDEERMNRVHIAPVPTYNGYHENFNNNKVMCYRPWLNPILKERFNLDDEVKLTENNWDYSNGWGVFEMPRDLDAFEVRDFRVNNMPIAIRTRDVINAIINPQNNGGHNVFLDTPFKIKNNKYYDYLNKTWIVFDVDKDEIGESYSDSTVILDYNNDFQYLDAKTPYVDNEYKITCDGSALIDTSSIENKILKLNVTPSLYTKFSVYDEAYKDYEYLGLSSYVHNPDKTFNHVLGGIAVEIVVRNFYTLEPIELKNHDINSKYRKTFLIVDNGTRFNHKNHFDFPLPLNEGVRSDPSYPKKGYINDNDRKRCYLALDPNGDGDLYLDKTLGDDVFKNFSRKVNTQIYNAEVLNCDFKKVYGYYSKSSEGDPIYKYAPVENIWFETEFETDDDILIEYNVKYLSRMGGHFDYNNEDNVAYVSTTVDHTEKIYRYQQVNVCKIDIDNSTMNNIIYDGVRVFGNKDYKTKGQLLKKLDKFTPLQILLSFTKLLGLKFYYNNNNNIYILTRENYYKDKIKNISDFVDRGDISIKLNRGLSYNYAYKYAEGKSYVEKLFENNDFGVNIYTDSESKNSTDVLKDSVIFNNSFTYVLNTPYFNKYSGYSGDDKTQPYSCLTTGSSVIFKKHINSNLDTEDVTWFDSTSNLKYTAKQNDVVDKLCRFGNDYKQLSDNINFVFFTGYEEVGEETMSSDEDFVIPFTVTDNLPIMNKLVGDNPCYILPAMSKYVEHTWDSGLIENINPYIVNQFGVPYVQYEIQKVNRIPLFLPISSIKETSNKVYSTLITKPNVGLSNSVIRWSDSGYIFDNFLKYNTNEIYNVEQKELSLKTLFKNKSNIHDIPRTLYSIDNGIYAINEINDFRVDNNSLSSVKYLKVCDLDDFILPSPEFKYDETNYITDGLVFWLDCIRQNGTDDTWCDLVNNVEFKAKNVQWVRSSILPWGNFSVPYFNGNGYFYTFEKLNFPYNNYTIEVVYYNESSDGVGTVFHSPYEGSIGYQISNNGKVLTYTSDDSVETSYLDNEKNKINFVSINNTFAVKNLNTMQTSGSGHIEVGSTVGMSTVGIDGDFQKSFKGYIFAIRIYDHLLSDDEMKINQQIDMNRYKNSL